MLTLKFESGTLILEGANENDDGAEGFCLGQTNQTFSRSGI